MGDTRLSRGELRQQYELAVAEYRFQVDLNWRRSEYFFVLNVGVLIAALSLYSSDRAPKWLVALLFCADALLAVLSVLANRTQHGYYTAARDAKAALEDRLALKEVAIATTPGMGSRIERLGSVGSFLRTMLVAIALIDVVGFSVLIHEEVSAASARRVAVAIRVQTSSSPTPTVLAVSDGEGLVAWRTLRSGATARPIELEPGTYTLWADTSPRCARRAVVSRVAFQAIGLTC